MIRSALGSMRLAITSLGVLLIGNCSTHHVSQSAQPKCCSVSVNYERALELLDNNLRPLVYNEDIVPNWMGDGETFWIALEGRDGRTFKRVVSRTGKQSDLFDHEEIAFALNDLSGAEVQPSALPLESLQYDETNQSIFARFAEQDVFCSLVSYECEFVEGAATLNDAYITSDDGKHSVFARDYNLWLKDERTGVERALTRNGEASFAYGKYPDTSLMAIPMRSENRPRRPFASFWSPNGSVFISPRFDERAVEEYAFVETVREDGSLRPKVHNLRIPLIGDPETAGPETHIFDIRSGKSFVYLPEDGFRIEPGALIGWNETGDVAYMLAIKTGLTAVRLLEFSVDGHRTIYEESRKDGYVRLAPSIYNRPGVRVLKGGEEILWYSERSGWGHLYRINVRTGQVINALTSGDWTVFDIIRVDEASETVYFTAGGREARRDPYYRHLYSVGFDGDGLTLYTPEDGDHDINGDPSFYFQTVTGARAAPERISPNGKYMVASHSTATQPPITLLRNLSNNEVIAQIATADVKELEAIDYRPPERFEALSADGETRIFGAIHYPIDFDEGKKYPIVNALYAGPQVVSAGIKYMDAFRGYGNGHRTALASLGFIVVTIDGRGTPYRSLEFQNFSRGTGHGDVTLADHKSAIEQLAEKRTYMDLSRIGITGHSWGGYHATRGVLLHNEFYDAAVASAGIQAYEYMYPGTDPFTGVSDFGGGRMIRRTSKEVPENLVRMGNGRLADQLEGKLLLAYGELDENVPPSQTIKLIKSLIKADKTFDLIFLPNTDHYFSNDQYFLKRKFEYLVENVLKAEPNVRDRDRAN